MRYPVEEVFRTEGVPEFTFVQPPNYGEILIDIRTRRKPVIVEGQSGTGKTTTVKKIIEELHAEKPVYLSARKAVDLKSIIDLANNGKNGFFIIDDFHHLDEDIQVQIANLVKLAAESTEAENFPKIVIIGINKVGSELIHLVHDIAKRCGIHKILPASFLQASELISKGEDRLNIKFDNHQKIFDEARGDYWLIQLVSRSICLLNNVTETLDAPKELRFSHSDLRQKVIARLEHGYKEAVKEFCRGKRFRSTNDPYLKLLKAVSEQDSSIIDLTELANTNQAVRGSINNIKEHRLSKVIASKPICERFFYYNPATKLFVIEDPALFYYLKHLDWEDIRKSCGFRSGEPDYEFDFAISFAGENRELAAIIADQIMTLDCSVFYDALFEANFLGKAWNKEFVEVFSKKSRYVICLLDKFHSEKIWPTFERECFSPRVKEEAVIPIFLDETVFVGIPRDIVGIKFSYAPDDINLDSRVTDELIFKLYAKLESL